MDGGSECTRPGQGWRRKSRQRTRCRSRCRCRRKCQGHSWRTPRGRPWRRSCPWRTASARWSPWWRSGPDRRRCTRSRRSRPGRSPRRTARRPRCACRGRNCPRRTPSARWSPGRRCGPERRACTATRPTGPYCPSRNRPRTAAASTRPARSSCPCRTAGSPSRSPRSGTIRPRSGSTRRGRSCWQRRPESMRPAELRRRRTTSPQGSQSSRGCRRRPSCWRTSPGRTSRAARATHPRGKICQPRSVGSLSLLSRSGRNPVGTACRPRCPPQMRSCRRGKAHT
mmetsp:Transcript_22519/g.74269  ORF Transcript_22519/g.74269 Transcript_22519/m.74269 type:complete len:283 (-) Transcript_22519:1985-2833(-)